MSSRPAELPGQAPAQTEARRSSAEIVAALTLAEKIRLLSGADMWNTEAIASVGLASVRVADGPHGLRKQREPSETLGMYPSVPATCFPPAVTLASSWDTALAAEVGRAVGLEARAQGVGVVLGPGLNLKRHPCCGRNFEYFSEDPLLSGKMAAAVSRGIQSSGAGACLKHFAVNNQETNRMVVDAVVDERTLRELYLSGFEIAVCESQPWTVMAAYNRVNGEYCTESRWLLTEVLRDEWGFDGLVMSDWGATNDRARAVAAGLDLEMPSSKGANDGVLARAVADGRLAEHDIDACVERVVALERRVEEHSTRIASGTCECDYDAHHELARRAAAESAVLLANDGTLPLASDGRIAVIGAFAEKPRYQGAGSSQVEPTRVDAALDAFRARPGGPARITYAAAYDPETGESDDSLLAEAKAAAAGADVAVVFIGLPSRYEVEGLDRDHLRLPPAHDALVGAICDANPRTVVVLSNGAPVEMSWAERPAAILEAYLGGQAGGSAIVDILHGDMDPGGRLAETFPLTLADVPSAPNFPGQPRQVQYREGVYVGYRYYETAEIPVLFPFGHGLSYASFDMGEPRVSASAIALDEARIGCVPLEVSVPVANTGKRQGSTVVQVYLGKPDAAVHRPRLWLAGFAKVRLSPGERTEAVIGIDERAFAYWDRVAGTWAAEPGVYEVLVGTSAVEICTRLTVEVKAGAGEIQASGPRPAHAPRSLIADDDEFAVMLGTPVPRPEPPLPFTRTSTVGDLGQTSSGRLVQRFVRTKAASQDGLGSTDPIVAMMMERAVVDLPLRSMVTMSAGRFSWRLLDSLIDVLNGRWGSGARRLLTRDKGGLR